MASWFDDEQQNGQANWTTFGPGDGSGGTISGLRHPPTIPEDASNAGRGVPGMDFRTGGGSGPTGGGGQVTDEAVQAILHKYPATNDGMRAAVAELDRTFGAGTIKLLDHPLRLDKLVMPDGRTIDAMVGAGAPGAQWGWMVEGGGHGGAAGGGAGGAGGTMGAAGFGSLLQSPMAGRNIVDDPSYQFRFGEGLKALERSAAARGTLLSGGTLKAITRYGQDVASTEYQNAYSRAFGEQKNVFDRLFSVSQLGANAASAAGGLASNYAANAGNTIVGAGNAAAQGTANQSNANAGIVTGIGEAASDIFAKRNADGKAPLLGGKR